MYKKILISLFISVVGFFYTFADTQLVTCNTVVGGKDPYEINASFKISKDQGGFLCFKNDFGTRPDDIVIYSNTGALIYSNYGSTNPGLANTGTIKNKKIINVKDNIILYFYGYDDPNNPASDYILVKYYNALTNVGSIFIFTGTNAWQSTGQKIYHDGADTYIHFGFNGINWSNGTSGTTNNGIKIDASNVVSFLNIGDTTGYQDALFPYYKVGESNQNIVYKNTVDNKLYLYHWNTDLSIMSNYLLAQAGGGGILNWNYIEKSDNNIFFLVAGDGVNTTVNEVNYTFIDGQLVGEITQQYDTQVLTNINYTPESGSGVELLLIPYSGESGFSSYDFFNFLPIAFTNSQGFTTYSSGNILYITDGSVTPTSYNTPTGVVPAGVNTAYTGSVDQIDTSLLDWDTNADGEVSTSEQIFGVLNSLTGLIAKTPDVIENLWGFIKAIMQTGNVTGDGDIMGFFIPTANASLTSDINDSFAGNEESGGLYNIIKYLKFGVITILFIISLVILLTLIRTAKRGK